MKRMVTLKLTAAVLVLALSMIAVGQIPSIEIRGQVATGGFAWNPQNFAGFYYDIKDNLGAENLTTNVTDGNKLSGNPPYGVTYQTNAQRKRFKFDDWGFYEVMGFMAKKYFAGYVQDNHLPVENQILYDQSTDENSLSDEQLEEVLVDDDTELTVISGTPLNLKQGYQLAIKSIDVNGNKVYLELFKDGMAVGSKAISTRDGATLADKTYYYRPANVGAQIKLVTIAVHFKNAFRSAEQDLATVDGEWQISDTPVEVKTNTDYGKMRIATVDSTNGIITMDNRDNQIPLNKNKNIDLLPSIGFRTADNATIRYYPYTIITEPGTYEVRGTVAAGDFTWNPQNFAGFFCDIKDDLGTENLTTAITDGNKLSGDSPYGVTYQTVAQRKGFKFEGWGYYNVMGFLSKKYFAGYVQDDRLPTEDQILYSESTDENSLSDEQLEEILVDDDTELTVTSCTPLNLDQGYQLAVKSIDIDGNKVYLELYKNGHIFDAKAITPSKGGATLADGTYYYKPERVGSQQELVTVAVHFKNAFSGAGQDLATVDGQWQISDTPVEVKTNTDYGKMRIATVDSTNGIITMDNKDNQITLSRNKSIELTNGISIKASDNATLRYYIYQPVIVEDIYKSMILECAAVPPIGFPVPISSIPSENAGTSVANEHPSPL